MSMPEVIYRAKKKIFPQHYRELIANRWNEILHRAKKKTLSFPQKVEIDGKMLAHNAHFIDWGTSKEDPFFDKALIEQYRSYANRTLNNIYDIFDIKDIRLRNIPDWQKDYSSDKSSPLISSSKINYRNFKKIGDVKYIWEINRHQYLLPIAMTYYFTGEEKYKEFVIETIEQWIAENPYMIGINWTSCLELALRIISWYFSLSFIAGRSAISEDALQNISKSVYMQAFHIFHNPSLYSSANNHLIGEMTGIVCAAAFLKNVKEVEHWRDKALEILERETDKQVYPDGVGVEQAPFYQVHTVDYYLLSGFLMKEMRLAVPDAYINLIVRSAQFFESIMNVKKEIPHIGDEDGSRAIQFHCSKEFNEYLSIINSAKILSGNIPEDIDKESIDEKTYLLLLKNKKYESFGKCAPFKKKYEFLQGGYSILGDNFGKDNEVKILFDSGPLGFESLSAHGHSDALSFVLSYKGKYFLIDSGTYKYYIDEKIRNYFRSTAAHNTIRVDNQDQSIIAGPFLWSYKAAAEILLLTRSRSIDEVVGVHYGYKRLRNPLVHQRTLKYYKNDKSLVINDELETSGMHFIEMFFHLEKECMVEINAEFCDIILGDTEIRMYLDNKLKWGICEGRKEPMLGWQSKYFGDLESCFTLVGKTEISSNENFTTKIELL